MTIISNGDTCHENKKHSMQDGLTAGVVETSLSKSSLSWEWRTVACSKVQRQVARTVQAGQLEMSAALGKEGYMSNLGEGRSTDAPWRGGAQKMPSLAAMLRISSLSLNNLYLYPLSRESHWKWFKQNFSTAFSNFHLHKAY